MPVLRLALLALSIPAAALGGASGLPGGFRLAPRFDAAAVWHSNLFLGEGGAASAVPVRGDLLAVFRPAFAAALGGGDSLLEAGARAGFEFLHFARHRDLDRNTPFAEAHARFDDGTVRLEAGFSHAESILPSQDFRPGNQLAGRASQAADLALRHEISPATAWRVRLSATRSRFEPLGGPPWPGPRTAAASVDLDHAFGPRLRAGLGCRQRGHASHTLPSVLERGAFLRSTWEIGPGAAIDASAGAGRSRGVSGSWSQRCDWIAMEARAGLGESLSFSSTLARDLAPGAWGGMRAVTRASLSLRWTPDERLAVRAGLAWSRLAPLDRRGADDEVQADIEVTRRFGSFVSAAATLRHAANRSSFAGQDYDAWTASFSVTAGW